MKGRLRSCAKREKKRNVAPRAEVLRPSERASDKLGQSPLFLRWTALDPKSSKKVQKHARDYAHYSFHLSAHAVQSHTSFQKARGNEAGGDLCVLLFLCFAASFPVGAVVIAVSFDRSEYRLCH